MTDLDALEQLLTKATPGPFEPRIWANPAIGVTMRNAIACPSGYYYSSEHGMSNDDMELDCALRNAAPAMIKELRALGEYYEARIDIERGTATQVNRLEKARAKVEALKSKNG